jgi:hypothetical protein
MNHEAKITFDDDGVLRVGDDLERLQEVVLRAMDGGKLDGDELRIGIPVEGDLAYWGRTEWHLTEDGHAGRANEIFAAKLSDVMGRDIAIHGFAPVSEGDEMRLLLMATVRD